MKKYFLLYACFTVILLSCKQPLTSEQLLDKTIAYHDPNSNWDTFNGTFSVRMETPSKPNRDSKVTINLPDDGFNLVATRDSVTTRYFINKGKCVISATDSLRIANQTKKPRRSHCEMTEFYKNYYTYLYGLPMKLKDPGTHISDTIEHKTFKGKHYLVLKASYDKGVGSDIWYFYFDPKTYAMEIYQFFRTDENGGQKADTGEYILLSDEVVINDIKMPKNRAWYTNKEDKLLGTDILNH